MKKHRLLSLLLALALLAGCAPTAEPPASDPVTTPAPDPIPTESAAIPAPTPEPTPEPTATPEPVDFREFLDGVNAARKAIVAQTEPIELPAEYIPDFYEQNNTFTEAEIALLTTEHEAEEDLTREDLIADAETFFALLKTTYGAYYYFGGDDTFLPLLDAVKEELSSTEAFTPRALSDILYKHLSLVLVDGHFKIGSHAPFDAHALYMYYVPNLYLDSMEGVENPDCIKPTIGPDGRICWWYAALSHDGSDLPNTLDGHTLKWKRALSSRNSGDAPVFSESEWEGIPVLTSRRMSAWGGNADPNEQALQRLSDCGGEYTGSSLLIFDVRGNPGGEDKYIDGWFQGWSDGKGQMRGAVVFRCSQLFYRLHSFLPSRYIGTYHIFSSSTGAWVERSGPVFVLQDKGTASAGEATVLRFHAAADALTVGGPTGGCYLTANNINLCLPHSGLNCRVGTGIIFNETGENQDGVGYLPDLWVEPTQAMDAVKKLIEYYGLNAEQ